MYKSEKDSAKKAKTKKQQKFLEHRDKQKRKEAKKSKGNSKNKNKASIGTVIKGGIISFGGVVKVFLDNLERRVCPVILPIVGPHNCKIKNGRIYVGSDAV